MLLTCTPSCLPDAKRSGWVRARPAAAGPKKVSNLSRVISQRERESTEQAAFPGAGARFLRPAFVSVGGSFTWAITELDKQPNQPNAPSAGPAPHASHARCPSYPRHVFLPAGLPAFRGLEPKPAGQHARAGPTPGDPISERISMEKVACRIQSLCSG